MCLVIICAGASAEDQGATTDIAARLEKVERMVNSQGLLELLNQVDKLQVEVQRLRGEVDQLTNALAEERDGNRKRYADLDARLARPDSTVAAPPAVATVNPPLGTLDTGAAPDSGLTAAPVESGTRTGEQPSGDGAVATDAAPGGESADVAATPAAPAPVATGAPATVGAAPPLPVSGDDKSAYYQAFNLLKAGRYDDAVAQFNGFLTTYPQSTFADSAQYWLGEAYYVQRRYEPAIAQYQKLISAYPGSAKLTNAMLKIGYSYHELGQLDAAKGELQALMKQYPGTTPARLAEERLQRIRLEQNP